MPVATKVKVDLLGRDKEEENVKIPRMNSEYGKLIEEMVRERK